MSLFDTMKPRYINEPLYNEILGITNDFLDPSSSKDSQIYEKEPRCIETSLWRTDFASPLSLHYIELSLY